jgi:hypothetical protein
MAVTNTPVVLPDGKNEPRTLNRKERRANLAKAQQAMRAWKKKGGRSSVAPPPEVEGLNKETPINEGLDPE